MNYTLLRNEINNDPTGQGYSTYLPDSPGKVVELLNTQSHHMVKAKMITAMGIMSSYGIGPVAGGAFLDKLENLTSSIPALRWAMKFLQQDTGIDIALGSSTVNGTEQTVANESTAPTGVTFSAPANQGAALSIGGIPPGEHKAVWVKRIVNASASAYNNDSATIRVQCDTSA